MDLRCLSFISCASCLGFSEFFCNVSVFLCAARDFFRGTDDFLRRARGPVPCSVSDCATAEGGEGVWPGYTMGLLPGMGLLPRGKKTRLDILYFIRLFRHNKKKH